VQQERETDVNGSNLHDSVELRHGDLLGPINGQSHLLLVLKDEITFVLLYPYISSIDINVEQSQGE
jgi:hypothetical protein